MPISKLVPKRFGTRLIIMTLLAGLIPVIIFGVLLEALGKRLTADMNTSIAQGERRLLEGGEALLQRMAENQIRQKTIDVARQLDLYLQAHPQETLRDLQNDAKFREIAIQPVGETGYTAIHESNTGINRFHKNPEIENRELQSLADKLPDFWSIMVASLGGKDSRGYYRWQEADGVVREKFMYIAPLKQTTADGIPLSVAATTYLDEFTQPIAAARAAFRETTQHLKQTVNSLSLSSKEIGFSLMGVSILLVLIMAYWLGLYFSRAITELRQAAWEVNQGNLNVRLTPSMSGEVGELCSAFNEMVAHLAETMVFKTRLEESEHKLRTIVEHSTNLFYSHNTDHVLTYMSPRTRDYLECEPEEALIRWTEFVTDNPVNQDGFAHTQRAIDTGERQPPFELELKGKSGRRIWVEVNESPVVEGGKTVAIVGALVDITERKRGEVALRESEARLLTLINATPDIICFKDSRGAWLLANTSLLNLYQIRGTDYRNKTEFELADYTAPIYQNAFRTCSQSDEAAWKKGTSFRSEELIPDVDGNDRVYDVIKIPIYHPDHSRKGLVVVGRDITEFKRAEEEKVHLQAQLTQAQKMESVGRLAGGVAHDFNNKIQAILGYTSLALTETSAESQMHRWLTQVRKAAQQSADLTRQLLAFARKQTVRPKVIDLNETVSGLLKMLQRIVGEDIEMHWISGRALWNLNMDPAQIDQVLANLVVNSRDAISGPGKIEIKTQNFIMDDAFCTDHPGAQPGDYVLLAISDDGCGMDEDILQNIFEPFFTTKEPGRGTGLGLATVYGIVKQNEGLINVQSQPGKGTTFRIFLPRFDGKATGTGTEHSNNMPPRGTETVLIVEDEESIVVLWQTILERQGYTVLTAHTPHEALRLAEDHQGTIHLLVTDVVMPEMNGKDLRDRVNAVKPVSKCIFISGYTTDVIAHHGVLDEGVNFLQKPFSVEKLAEKVREVLDS